MHKNSSSVAKMVLTNQISWFLDHSYLQKESMNVFRFFSHIYYRKEG